MFKIFFNSSAFSSDICSLIQTNKLRKSAQRTHGKQEAEHLKLSYLRSDDIGIVAASLRNTSPSLSFKLVPLEIETQYVAKGYWDGREEVIRHKGSCMREVKITLHEDYMKTLAPVIQYEGVRALLASACHFDPDGSRGWNSQCQEKDWNSRQVSLTPSGLIMFEYFWTLSLWMKQCSYREYFKSYIGR